MRGGCTPRAAASARLLHPPALGSLAFGASGRSSLPQLHPDLGVGPLPGLLRAPRRPKAARAYPHPSPTPAAAPCCRSPGRARRRAQRRKSESWCHHLVAHLVPWEGRPGAPRLGFSPGELTASSSEIRTPLGHQLTGRGRLQREVGRDAVLSTFSAVCKALRCCCYPPSGRKGMHFQQGINETLAQEGARFSHGCTHKKSVAGGYVFVNTFGAAWPSFPRSRSALALKIRASSSQGQ